MNKTLLALSISANLFAANAMANNKVNDTLVVTASRTTQQQFDVLAPVDVFDREDIELINPESLADLLSRVAGISTTTSGTAGNSTALFVRGGNSDHVLLLIDGVRIGSATLGQKNTGDIPLQMIERVEVIRGPRAALWGSDAIGGVIQIFTRKLDGEHGTIGAEVGSDNYWGVHGAFGLGNENHRYTLAASASKTDGFDVLNPDPNGENDDDGYDRQSLSLNGRSTISDSYSLGLSAQFDKGTTEFDSSFGGNEVTFENYFMQLSNQFIFAKGFVELKLAQSEDKNHDNADKLFSGALASQFETKRNQINMVANMTVTDNVDVSGGVDWLKEEVTSHTLYAQTDRTSKAAFVVGRGQFGKVKAEASLRYDEVGETESETTTQLAVGYQFTDNLLFSLSQGTAFKAPTFNDLYWPDEFGSVGNASLKSELADNTELMLRYRSDDYSVEVSAYETDYENLIEWRYNPATQYFSPANVEQAKVKGAEVTVTFATGILQNRISLSHIDAKNVQSGQQLLRRPIFSGFYELSYQGDSFDTNFELRHQGQRNDTGGQVTGYTLANVSVNFALSKNVNLRGKINNLTDKQYIQAAAWPDAQTSAYQGSGRTYSFAVDYQF